MREYRRRLGISSQLVIGLVWGEKNKQRTGGQHRDREIQFFLYGLYQILFVHEPQAANWEGAVRCGAMRCRECSAVQYGAVRAVSASPADKQRQPGRARTSIPGSWATF
ncbi:hypothetical protein AOQ84DRAFT_116350 [Glonium stellatum]|uniref:Uncharacterized protein n=1 Tax=Glonium stellatum TaxID=574774 RepID=A0A8E2ETE4_9PEZI|nr:hypothetical protein AOQ84DRAFT_116350 [Glonium stellatum]